MPKHPENPRVSGFRINFYTNPDLNPPSRTPRPWKANKNPILIFIVPIKSPYPGLIILRTPYKDFDQNPKTKTPEASKAESPAQVVTALLEHAADGQFRGFQRN